MKKFFLLLSLCLASFAALADQPAMSHADKAKLDYQQYKSSHYRISPETDLYWQYAILQGERVDRGEISEAEANYLISKKNVELQNEIKERRRSAIMMMFHRQPRIHCESTAIGMNVDTDCN